MAIDLKRLANFTTSSTALAGLVLVTPRTNIGYQATSQTTANNTRQNISPRKFLFDFEAENTAELQSNITDHYVEDNSTISDHISLAPEKITVQGFVGELNDIAPLELEDEQNIALQKLLLLGQFTPDLTAAALINYNATAQAFQAVQSATSQGIQALASLKGDDINVIGNDGVVSNVGSSVQTRQQNAFQEFYGYWKNRTLFSVQTPWAIFQNMAIESMKSIQSADSQEVSQFEITFKIMRFAGVELVQNDLERQAIDKQARASAQFSETTDFGRVTPEPSISLLSVV